MISLFSKLDFDCPRVITMLFFYLLLSFFFSKHLEAEQQDRSIPLNKEIERSLLKEFLLKKEDPLHEQLRAIFDDKNMFQSSGSLKKKGFKIISHDCGKRIMVAEHPSIPQFLFKKFTDKIDKKTQLKNYLNRIQGAEIIRESIQRHQFQHLIVPKKFLYRLSEKFPSHSYLLIVEKLDLYHESKKPKNQYDPKSPLRKLYYDMNIDILRELCTVLHEIKGCDSMPRNQPFTRTGKIAFIDTENVGKNSEHFYTFTVPALNPMLQNYATELWERLDREDYGEDEENQDNKND